MTISDNYSVDYVGHIPMGAFFLGEEGEPQFASVANRPPKWGPVLRYTGPMGHEVKAQLAHVKGWYLDQGIRQELFLQDIERLEELIDKRLGLFTDSERQEIS